MKNRTVLRVNLETKESFYLKIPEVHNYIGGEPAAIYLLSKFREENPEIPYMSFTTGPLSGIFPYASKAIFLESGGKNYKTNVGGGRLPALMNFAGLDSIEIIGKSEQPILIIINNKEVQIRNAQKEKLSSFGVSGRRAQVIVEKNAVIADNYFKYAVESTVAIKSNLKGISFSPVTSKKIEDKEQYTELYKKILKRKNEVIVSSGSYPSCFGCPLGCAFSKTTEDLNISVLPRSLVSCGFAESIYNDVNLVFACFQILKYDYNHDFLEAFSSRIGNFLKEFNNNLSKLHASNS